MMPSENLPDLTELEVEFLRLLPVDSLAQGMPGASFVSLANDLGQNVNPDKEAFIFALIRGLNRKGVKVVHYDGCWAFLSQWDSLRLRDILDSDNRPDDPPRRIRSYSEREWKPNTLLGSRRRYHGQARDDV